MRKCLRVIILLMITSISLVHCTKKGTAISEPNFGNYSFSTFTVDTFRFKIILDGITLTDSLVSPIGFFSKYVSFFGAGNGRLLVVDAKNNDQLVLDTLIKMQTGNNNFSIVQFSSGQKPYIAGLPANEPPPAAGNYKVRFQYLKSVAGSTVPNNPVKCVFRNTTTGISDTVILNTEMVTKFYEARSVENITTRILNPLNNALIYASNSSIPLLNRSGFNTVIIRGNGISPNSLYDIIKAY